MHMPTRKPSVDLLTLKHFWKVGTLYRKEFLLYWFTIVSALGISLAVPYLIGKTLGNLTVPGEQVDHYIYALIAVSAISVLANRISYDSLFMLQVKVMSYLQTEVLNALMNRSAGFHNNRVSGKLVSDAADYPSAYNQLSNAFFIDIIPFGLIIVLGIILVSINSPLIGLVILLMTALAIGSTIRFRRRMTTKRIQRQAASKNLTAHLADTIINNQTVKAFGNETEEIGRHQVLNKKLAKLRAQDWRELAVDGSYRVFGLLFFQIAFIIVVVHQVRNDPALLATGIFAFSYTMTISNRLFQIGNMMRTAEEALLLAMPITEMLQENPEIQDAPDAKELVVREGRIVFKDVIFYYDDNPKHDKVFANLNITIKPGEKIGIVGPSGGGKSTLTKLMLRFEDVQNGHVIIDGQNIADITQTSLRKAIAYVPQEPLLFHRSIKENIAYGRPDAADKDIEHAARLANAHAFITKLPDGYDTIVGERGVKLSGGQRQRVAIARAMLKNAPILVLDEATSALDSESEVAIQQALWKLMQGRTTVVVAHRLSTIQRLDRIIVLDGGNIAEEGTHADLLQRKGLYARLWSHQSGGFINE
ncbi:MAG: ABC-type multidrug transport system, ATPase and permease component [Candidatus Saccharibacteria bacterium]|nr:ABC-type multidrug transport system, ATPase and permease component [Candidatus Saccharibacteria bacterium]